MPHTLHTTWFADLCSSWVASVCRKTRWPWLQEVIREAGFQSVENSVVSCSIEQIRNTHELTRDSVAGTITLNCRRLLQVNLSCTYLTYGTNPQLGVVGPHLSPNSHKLIQRLGIMSSHTLFHTVDQNGSVRNASLPTYGTSL